MIPYEIRCPACGLMPVRTVTRYGTRNDCCGLWSWDDKPLVDRETHDARRAAHEAFDPLWHSGSLSRREAYAALAWALGGMKEKKCHMARMKKETAMRVPDAVKKIWQAMEVPA